MSTGLAVEITSLVKRYGRVTAVNGLSLRARRAAVTAILGPNGAGKTTTIEICEGYRRPDDGEVRVLGLDPARNGAAGFLLAVQWHPEAGDDLRLFEALVAKAAAGKAGAAQPLDSRA